MSVHPHLPNEPDRAEALRILEAVDALSEDTKDMALNLALYLAKAKAKGNAEFLKQLEPEFVRLINGTIKVVQEITTIVNAAKNRELMAFQLPSGEPARDHIQAKLEAVGAQCDRILESLSQVKGIKV
jgi:hypothetical protein